MLTSEENGLKPFGYCYDRHPLPPIITHVVISTGSEMLIRWIISTPPQVTLLQPPTPLHFTLFHCKHRSALIAPTSLLSTPYPPTPLQSSDFISYVNLVMWHMWVNVGPCRLLFVIWYMWVLVGFSLLFGTCGSSWVSVCFITCCSVMFTKAVG